MKKFYEKVKDVIIYKDIDGKYLTLDEYLDGKGRKKTFITFLIRKLNRSISICSKIKDLMPLYFRQ